MRQANSDTLDDRRRDAADPEIGAQVGKPKQLHQHPFQEKSWTSFRWMMLFLFSLLAVSLDPLFFYIPVMNDKEMCMTPDKTLGVIAIVLRSCVDAVHTLFWLLCYEDQFRDPLRKLWICIVKKCWRSRIRESRNKEVVDDSSVSHKLIREAMEADALFAIKEKSEKSTKHRVIEIASVLPLSQVVTILIILRSGSPQFKDAVTLLKFSVLYQLIMRTLRVHPAYSGAIRHSLLLFRGHVWVGSALNLLLFMISAHVIGAFWYLLSLGRNMDCWKNACRSHDGCHIASLYCGGVTIDKSFLNATCRVDSSSDSPPFNFGIYSNALKFGIVNSNDFLHKLGYCFWWGLQNLSSLGQNLSTSAHLWEVYFAISISVIGLILFSLFIGNMQMYLQTQTDKDLKETKETVEKRVKLRTVWMSLVQWKPFSSLPEDLRYEIFRCDNLKWLETKDVDLKSMIQHISPELGMQIKSKLCFPILSEMPALGQVDESSLKALCWCATPVVFGKNRSILLEDTPINKMYIVIGGDLCYVKEDGSTIKTPRRCTDKFLGEELLHRVLDNKQLSKSCSLFSNMTIMARTKVEAFSITESDIRRVRSQFRGRFYKRVKEESPDSPRSATSLRKPAGNKITTAVAI